MQFFWNARSDTALKELARLAQGFGGTHMIMGEQKMVERFWTSYAEGGQRLRHLGREVLLELNQAPRTWSRFQNCALRIQMIFP